MKDNTTPANQTTGADLFDRWMRALDDRSTMALVHMVIAAEAVAFDDAASFLAAMAGGSEERFAVRACGLVRIRVKNAAAADDLRFLSEGKSQI